MNESSPWIGAAFAALVVIPVQTLLLPVVLPLEWLPHVGLLAVFLLGMTLGETVGVVSGLVIGLIYDRFTAGGVGIYMFLLPCVGAAAAAIHRLVPEMGFVAQFITLVFLAVSVEVCAAVVFSMAGVIHMDRWSMLHQLLPGIVSDLLFGSALLLWSAPNRRPLLP